MSTATQEIQLVVFRLGGTQYALPITQVQEIIRYTKPLPVASNDSSAHGVLNLRGRIIPVHDITVDLGVELQLDEAASIMIIDNGSETVGVIVEAVDEVLSIERDQLQRPPSTTNTELVEAIVNLERRLIVLLEPGMIFGIREDGADPTR